MPRCKRTSGVEYGARGSHDDDMSLAGSCIKGSGVWEKRMGRQGKARQGGGGGEPLPGGGHHQNAIQDEMVHHSEVVLTFVSEGFYVARRIGWWRWM